MFKNLLYFLVSLLACPFFALADPVTYQADRLEGELVNNKPCKKLEGHVVITFDAHGIVLTADRACKYDDQDVIQAEGNVKIVDREGSVLESGSLTYDLEKKQAIFEGDVSCSSKKATFYTSKLVYDVDKKQGNFLQGGKLVQDQMVLTSNTGLYDGAHHQIIFSSEVVLVDPSYRLHCDQLNYHTESEIGYFVGDTKIVHHEGVLTTAKGGHYLVPKKQLVFDHGTFTTEEIILSGDHLEIVDGKECAADGHVSLRAKKHDAVIVGHKASYSQKKKKGEIAGSPLLTKVVNGSPIYLRADAFIVLEKAINNQTLEQEIHALGHLQLYQEELQGVADGAVYNATKNTIHLHNKPVIWCNNYQITGEQVYLSIDKESEVVQLCVDKDLFMVSADPVGNYNQVKGHKMVALFKQSAIQKMSIMGNSESLYFALGDKNELMGMNHMKCDNMEMTMVDNALETMICKPKPQGVFYPAEKIEDDQMRLDGFVWHGEKWPTKENILEKSS